MKQENRNLVIMIVLLLFGLSLVAGCLSSEGNSETENTKEVNDPNHRQCVCHTPPSCDFDVCSAGFDNGHLNHGDPPGRCNRCGNDIRECCVIVGPTDACGTAVATDCCSLEPDCNPATEDCCSEGAPAGCVEEECDDGDNDCTTNDCTADCKIQPNCDDGNPCTDDSCNNGPISGGGGLCINTPNDDPCDDDDDCTLGDQCIGGVCTPGGPKDCSDGISCTIDSCEPDGGVCSSDDSQCQCFEDADCDDANSCTDEVCVDNICQRSNNIAPCDDEIFCNGPDTCGGGACSDHAGDPCTANENECDNDCNEDLDNCNDPQGVPCTDDQNVCTDDFCDGLGECGHTSDITNVCSDGNACTTVDACVAGNCIGGSPPDCNDAEACTDDSCNPASGCVNAPIDGGAPITCGVGICERTVDSCVNGQTQDCIPGTPNPTGEICENGLDDDCNGLVDDGCGELAGCIALPGNEAAEVLFGDASQSKGVITIPISILDPEGDNVSTTCSADQGEVNLGEGEVTYVIPTPLDETSDGILIVSCSASDSGSCQVKTFQTTLKVSAAGDSFGSVGCALIR